ncbi:MAG: hypothetical protein KKB04_00395 [Candidatus Thermoplasmatota archaeon]|nr:hypothetical protein [Candidatus Thermoplasmatota archaeon]
MEKNNIKVNWYTDDVDKVNRQLKIVLATGLIATFAVCICGIIYSFASGKIIILAILVFVPIATIISVAIALYIMPRNIGTSSIGIHIQRKMGDELLKWDEIRNIKLKRMFGKQLWVCKIDSGVRGLGFNEDIRQKILNEFESYKKIKK